MLFVGFLWVLGSLGYLVDWYIWGLEGLDLGWLYEFWWSLGRISGCFSHMGVSMGWCVIDFGLFLSFLLVSSVSCDINFCSLRSGSGYYLALLGNFLGAPRAFGWVRLGFVRFCVFILLLF